MGQNSPKCLTQNRLKNVTIQNMDEIITITVTNALNWYIKTCSVTKTENIETISKYRSVQKWSPTTIKITIKKYRLLW